MSGRATFATARLRLATAAARIKVTKTSRARAGTAELSSAAATTGDTPAVAAVFIRRASARFGVTASSGWDEPSAEVRCDAGEMAETVSTAEVAHELGHAHGKHESVGRRAELIEILEAILLAMVAVATAWSGYQTARWDGRQAHLYGLTNKYRALSNKAATRSGQEELYDTSTFSFWLQATGQGAHEDAARFERRFRLESALHSPPGSRPTPSTTPRRHEAHSR